MTVPRKSHPPSAALAAALLGATAFSNHSAACLTPKGANPAPYRELAGTSAGRLVWISGTTSSGAGYRASGTLLDPWNVLTAAHLVPDGSIIHFVGTGLNKFTDPGTTAGVVKWIRYPAYTGGFSRPDLAILHLAQPINIAPAAFAAVSPGEVVIAAGFGRYGTPSAGLKPDDGGSMGWRAPVLTSSHGSISAAYFYSTDFDIENRVSLNGKALSGDSGGPVWNASGTLAGITVAQFGNLDSVGGTVAQRLDVPEVLTWIETNRSHHLPILSIAPAGPAVRLTWDAAATGYRLQASGDLTGWADLGSLITSPGTHDDPAAAPSRFYRLIKP